RKIFVSYKFKDNNVQALPNVTQPTWPCDYVDYIKNTVLKSDDIYKGENSDEDISSWTESAIWEHLKDKIYDSSITIVLISPNMKEVNRWQKSQWIPWEISFSVRETVRNNRKSHRNAVLGVILPDKNGSYSYYKKNDLFPILKNNIEAGYIYVVQWDDFIKYAQVDMNIAEKYKGQTPEYKIDKTV
ncbi:MAG: TIR domain-containing protein, partial [Firmicutes bacterium]|nr:TIR domain-containing protein [Bacillota bacterium]